LAKTGQSECFFNNEDKSLFLYYLLKLFGITLSIIISDLNRKYNISFAAMEPYNINLDIKYEHLQVIDVPDIILLNKEQWFNQTLTQVNGSVVRLGIIQGEFHWHKHENDDEFFFVLEGKLFIDLEDRVIELEKNQGVTISKGVMHRPRAPQKVVMLMVETADIKPTGD